MLYLCYVACPLLFNDMRLSVSYDKSWKEVVTHLTDDFIAYFFPELYQLIDRSVPYEFLEQELFSVLEQKDSYHKRRKAADKLVKVQLLDHSLYWILIHIEFQGDKAQDVAARMYQYYRRIEEKYGNTITALVIYTGNTVPRQKNEYRSEYFGSGIRYRFNTYEVREQSETDLLQSTNPFALVVLSNWYVLHTKSDARKRFLYKRKLLALAQQANYTKEQALFLYYFVAELMTLPEDLADELSQITHQHTLNKKNNTDMKHSRHTREHINALAINEFGVEVMAAAAKIEKADKRAETEAKRAEKASHKLRHAIIRSYTKHQMTIDEIADLMNEKPEYIRNLLTEEGVLSAD